MYYLASLAFIFFTDVSEQINNYTANAVIIASSVAGLVAAFQQLRKPKRTAPPKAKAKAPKVVTTISQDDVDEIGARR